VYGRKLRKMLRSVIVLRAVCAKLRNPPALHAINSIVCAVNVKSANDGVTCWRDNGLNVKRRSQPSARHSHRNYAPHI